MKKTRILSIILAAVMVFALVLTGCNSGGNADKNTGSADYAVILKPLSNDFWAKMKAGIEEEAKKQGVTVDIFASTRATRQSVLLRFHRQTLSTVSLRLTRRASM